MNLTFDLWPWKSIGFQTLLRTKYVPGLVKIHWRIVILECSQGCYVVKIWPGDLDLWPWKSIEFQILLRTQCVPSLVKIRGRMLILECSQECYGRTEGRTDGSVTISLRNFVGEGIIRKIYIPIFDCIASIIDECYSRNSPKLLNHLNVYFYQHSSDNPFPNSLSHARKYFQTEDVKMAICELLNMFNVITSNAHNIETEKSGNNFKDFKLPCSICYVDTRCMTTVRIWSDATLYKGNLPEIVRQHISHKIYQYIYLWLHLFTLHKVCW
jgi:hypothetical protein